MPKVCNQVWMKMWKKKSFFWIEKCEKCLFLRVSPFPLINKEHESHFRIETAMKINSFKKQKLWYLIHSCAEKPFKGAVVNRALQSLPAGSFKENKCYIENKLKVIMNNHFKRQLGMGKLLKMLLKLRIISDQEI